MEYWQYIELKDLLLDIQCEIRRIKTIEEILMSNDQDLQAIVTQLQTDVAAIGDAVTAEIAAVSAALAASAAASDPVVAAAVVSLQALDKTVSQLTGTLTAETTTLTPAPVANSVPAANTGA